MDMVQKKQEKYQMRAKFHKTDRFKRQKDNVGIFEYFQVNSFLLELEVRV